MHRNRFQHQNGLIVAAIATGASPQCRLPQNIAVAVDTSQASLDACRWVASNLYRTGDTIHLLHCVPSLPQQGLYALADGRLVSVNLKKLLHSEDEYLREVERIVADWVYKVFQPLGIPFVIDVVQENAVTGGLGKWSVAEELCRRAGKLDSTLVLSSHTRGGVSEIVMGSVAADCARHCDTPVVVLHSASQSTGAPPAAGAGRTVQWLHDLWKQVGAPGTAETAAESIAFNAASGPLHAPQVSQQQNEKGIVTSSDFSDGDDDANLIGQVVGEVPGTDVVAEQRDSLPVSLSLSHPPRCIVVTVDDSDASEKACLWAAVNMWRQGDTLHLLHVIPSMPSVITAVGPMSGGLSSSLYSVFEPPTEAYKKATEEYMERRFHGALRSAGVAYESDVLVELTDGSAGSVGKAIVDRVDALNAVAVVIGSHTRGGLAEMLLGSVASWVCHHTDKPVVVLH